MTDAGLVAVLQPEDRVVDAGLLGGADDIFRCGIGKARDVLRNGALDQLDVLWDVANVLAECIRIPLCKRRSKNPSLRRLNRSVAPD